MWDRGWSVPQSQALPSPINLFSHPEAGGTPVRAEGLSVMTQRGQKVQQGPVLASGNTFRGQGLDRGVFS